MSNIFACLGDDGDEPKPVVAAPVVEAKKAAAKPAVKANSSAARPEKSAAREPARTGGRGGGRGGQKSYEAGEDQTFSRSRDAGRGRGAGRDGGKGRAPRRDGDAEGERRPKKDFDRHVSRTGHGPVGDKRAGHGKGNWGAEGETGEPASERTEEPVAEAPAEEVVPEEEDKEMSLAEYETQQAEVRAKLNSVKEAKGVDASAFNKMTLMKKNEDEDEDAYGTTKKKGGKKQSNKERKTVETINGQFRFQDTSGYADRSEGGKGGKGGGRGRGAGRGRGPAMDHGGRGGRDLSVNDAESFPTLGK